MKKTSSSRLRRNITKNNKNTAIFSLLGLITFVIAGFFLFPYIIEGIGNLATSVNKDDASVSTQKEEDTIFTPPLLIEVPDATSSARIRLKGTSDHRGTVEIYVNRNLQDQFEVEENEEFETDPLRLKEGNNDITTKLSTIDGDSKLSDAYSITFLSKEPTLDITFPQDGAKFTKADKRIELQGKTDEDNNVTVNGAKVIVGRDGTFAHLIELNEGENELTIIATNQAGKTVEKKLRVNYARE